MAVRPVLQYPHAVLKQPAASAGPITDSLRQLARDLVETMKASPATVGLAAPQVGEPVRLFVLDVTGHPRAPDAHGLLVLLDPEVVEREGPVTAREGCLSVPHLTANVGRAARIVMEARTLEDRAVRLELDGFEARAAQHEVDHLDGLLILDRVRSAADLFVRRVYR